MIKLIHTHDGQLKVDLGSFGIPGTKVVLEDSYARELGKKLGIVYFITEYTIRRTKQNADTLGQDNIYVTRFADSTDAYNERVFDKRRMTIVGG